MGSSDSQIDKLQRGRSKRAELPAVNINTVAQNISTESAFLMHLTRLRTNSSKTHFFFFLTTKVYLFY